MTLPAGTTSDYRPKATATVDELIKLGFALKAQLLVLSASTGCAEFAVPVSSLTSQEKDQIDRLHTILRLTGISVSLRREAGSDFHVFRLDPA